MTEDQRDQILKLALETIERNIKQDSMVDDNEIGLTLKSLRRLGRENLDAYGLALVLDLFAGRRLIDRCMGKNAIDLRALLDYIEDTDDALLITTKRPKDSEELVELVNKIASQLSTYITR